MIAALETHARKKTERLIAKPWRKKPLYLRNLSSRRRRGCVHCHNAKEMVLADKWRNGKWTRNDAYRYPPPDNLGLTLDVDKGDIVKSIQTKSAAAVAGLRKGDIVDSLNGQPVNSFADAQYALDAAPNKGSIPIVWYRDGKRHSARIALKPGWRKTDIRWRPSMIDYIGMARVNGYDLNAKERKKYGLKPKQLAFRHQQRVHSQAKAAGIKAGDIILGFDDVTLKTDAYEFQRYVRKNYIVGDKVKVNLIRNGKRTHVMMLLK